MLAVVATAWRSLEELELVKTGLDLMLEMLP
jgi:hypothetical protein